MPLSWLGKLGHPAYDCFYLTLAKQQEASLVTTDQRLINIAEKLNIKTLNFQD